jgi:hypothetical protein
VTLGRVVRGADPPRDVAERSPEPGDGALQSGDISSLTATLPLRLSAKNRHAIGATFPETVRHLS